MNLRRRHKIGAEVNTSSLNDIMFFLLLFFLIASTVVNPNVLKLLLPRSETGQSVSKRTVTISITKELVYFVEKRMVPEAAIESELQSFLAGNTDLTAILYVDRGIAIENVVSVMDICNRNKIKLVLATDKK